MSTSQSLERLFSLHPKLIDLSLGRIERLLADMGHPERQLPPVIHVAGTNGKGSTTAFLHALLTAQGKAAQAYTSPHLVRFHERIRLSSGLISETDLQQVLDDIEAFNDGKPITFFEVTTVAAFYAFARDEADYCLIEVGLGGKYDATNVIDRPAACIITPVAMDHENFFGSELTGIAEEKAGILKPGVPAFIARQDPAAMGVISQRAADINTPIYFPGRDWSYARKGDVFVFEDRHGSLSLPLPSLGGAHQLENAALAIACVRHLIDGTDEADIAAAMHIVQWPARLQLIDQGLLFDLREGQGTLTLDGAHNVHAAKAIATHYQGQKINMVLGMKENRDISLVLEALSPVIGFLAAVPIPGEACHPPADIAEVAVTMGLEAKAFKGVEDAIRALPAGDCLIVGSLYLAGHVLEISGMAPK